MEYHRNSWKSWLMEWIEGIIIIIVVVIIRIIILEDGSNEFDHETRRKFYSRRASSQAANNQWTNKAFWWLVHWQEDPMMQFDRHRAQHGEKIVQATLSISTFLWDSDWIWIWKTSDLVASLAYRDNHPHQDRRCRSANMYSLSLPAWCWVGTVIRRWLRCLSQICTWSMTNTISEQIMLKYLWMECTKMGGGAIFIVNFIERVAQKLRIIILLYFD